MKTFLFDLDGTLLGMNTRSFTETYFGELARALHGLVPADGLARNMLSATTRMQQDDSPGGTNLTKFRAALADLYPDVDHQAVWDRIMEFYATTFDRVQDVVSRNEPLHRSVDYLRGRGCRVLLTTNPIFPQLATYKRLAWAGFAPAAFEYISTMENCTYSKPNARYWQYVTTLMHVDPAQAVAVGNDASEDGSARAVGIETYLVTDYLLGDAASSGADHVSDSAGFERWVRATY